MRRGQKIAGIVLGALLLLGLGAMLAIRLAGPAYLLDYLRQEVEQETQGRYTLALDSLDFTPWTMSVHLGELALERDTQAQRYSGIPLLDQFDVTLTFRSLDIRYFDLARYVFRKTLRVESLVLDHPSLEVRKNRMYDAKASQEVADSLRVRAQLDSLLADSLRIDSVLADTLAASQFTQTGSALLPVLELGALSITGAQFALYDGRKPEPIQEVNGLNLQVRSVRSDEDSPFLAEALSLRVDSASALVAANTARLNLFDLHITPDSFHLDSLRYRHVVTPVRLNRIKGFRSSWLDIKVGDIDLEGVHYERMIADSALVVERVTIGAVDLDFFKDKEELRINPAYKALPQELIREASLPLEIDTVRILRADLDVHMQAARAYAPGLLTLDGMTCTITNLTNLPEKLAENPNMQVAIRTRLMNAAPLAVDYRFMLTSPQDAYWVSVRSSDLDATLLNNFIGSQFFITFKSGYVETLDLSYRGTNKANVGELYLEYHDLHLEKLQNYRQFIADKPKTGFLAAVAEVVVPSHRGPEVKNYEGGVVYYEKEFNRDFIHGTIQSTLAGILSIWGLGPTDLNKMQEKAQALTAEQTRKAAEKAQKQATRAEKKKQRAAERAERRKKRRKKNQ